MAHTAETQQWLDETRDAPAWLAALKVALRERKISQAEVARSVGCSASNVSALLNWEARHTVPYVPKYLWRYYGPMVRQHQERAAASLEAAG